MLGIRYFISLCFAFLVLYPLAVLAEEEGFSVNGRIGPHSAPDHEVVVSVIGDSASIVYPELNCSGPLVPSYVAPEGLLSQLNRDGAIEFTEIVSGSNCPTGGYMMISADGSGGYLLERQGGTTGARTWSGSVRLTRNASEQTIPGNIALPQGTIAGDSKLGLFLGAGSIEPGIGPTSFVTGVSEGSIPALFGIQQGDVILHVDKGAADPAGHIQMILTGLSRDGAADVAVRGGTTGEERIVSLYAPEKEIEAQLRTAARNDVFGPAHDPISFRIRLFADEAFEALDFLAQADWDTYTTYGGARWERILTPASPTPRYDHLVAAYGTARFGFLGSCDEPVVTLTATGGSLTEHRVGGATVRTTDTRYEQPFEAIKRFAPVIQATNYQRQRGVFGWTVVMNDFEPVFESLLCNSEERRSLEANLLTYAR